MNFAVVLVFLVVPGFVSACRPRVSGGCDDWDSNTPTPRVVAASSTSTIFPLEGVSVPITWTVFPEPGLNATVERIQAQLDVINADYAGTGFSFRTVGIEYLSLLPGEMCQNDSLAIAARTSPIPTSRALHVVLCRLNDQLGYAYMGDEESNVTNSLFLTFASMPGGLPPYDLGRTLTHEMGHMLGLKHVFGKSCSKDGDGVADTPIQKTATTGCPRRKDSCPRQPGADSIHNFMDYGNDACTFEFTPGQAAFMRTYVMTYRPTLMAYDVPLEMVPYAMLSTVPRAGYLSASTFCRDRSLSLAPRASSPAQVWYVINNGPGDAMFGAPATVFNEARGMWEQCYAFDIASAWSSGFKSVALLASYSNSALWLPEFMGVTAKGSLVRLQSKMTGLYLGVDKGKVAMLPGSSRATAWILTGGSGK